jgi:hypothetical protein
MLYHLLKSSYKSDLDIQRHCSLFVRKSGIIIAVVTVVDRQGSQVLVQKGNLS